MYYMITEEGLFATIGNDKPQQLADKIKSVMESLAWRVLPEREGAEILCLLREEGTTKEQ